MASVANIKMKFGFADETLREMELGPFDPEAAAVTNAKSNIKNFNPENVKNIYISDAGATCTGITSAVLNIYEEKDINLKEE